jgi:Mg-chelatase subunit ChlI
MPRLVLAAVLISLAARPAAGGQSGPSPVETKTLNLSAYAELLRADIRVQKVAIITEVMGFTEAEDKAFWPIYRDYDAQMTRLGDERIALVAEYAKVIDQMTDEAADSLARKAIDLEHKRQEARAKCYERVKSALSGRTALRFLQVEHQLQLLIDLQIAAALPISAR